jgi:uncharacterized membrane protein
MPKWLISVGRVFYAVCLVGIGVQHFIFANFIPVILPWWPAGIPGTTFWAYVVGVALVGAGVSILFGIRARTVAAVLGAVILVLVVIDAVPDQMRAYPAHLGVWTNAFKALSLAGGAWIVAGSAEEKSWGGLRFLEPVMPYGKYFLPITVVVFGIDHFLYTGFVATLVPGWIPGKVFWTYFAGVALIVSGLAMILKIWPRMASLMLGIMIFLWVPLLHIPRAIADPHSGMGNEWTSVFEAIGFSGIAFMLAALPSSNSMAISSTE